MKPQDLKFGLGIFWCRKYKKNILLHPYFTSLLFICLPVVILTTFFSSAFSQNDLQIRQVVVESLLTQPFKDGGKKIEYIIVIVSTRLCFKMPRWQACLVKERQCTVKWLILLVNDDVCEMFDSGIINGLPYLIRDSPFKEKKNMEFVEILEVIDMIIYEPFGMYQLHSHFLLCYLQSLLFCFFFCFSQLGNTFY